MNMTPKQKAFADFFIKCGNQTEAAIKAGYSERSANVIASENLTKPYIREYIDERMKVIESKRIATGDEVLQYLTSVMRGEEKDQFDLDASLQDRTKAAELIGKRYRLFTDRVEVKSEDEEKKVKAISNIESMFKQMTKPAEDDVSD